MPDDIPGVAGLLKTYCAALESANRPKLAGQQQWDERCPPDLALAKREYLYAESIASARLEKQRADELWAKKCFDSTGQLLKKDDDGLVKCLKVLAGGKEPVLAGRFLLTFTIVEI